jgi:hypothetical protein
MYSYVPYATPIKALHHASTAQSHARPQSHHHAGRSALPPPAAAVAKPKLFNPRHPERTLLYQTIAEHFETWHELASAGQFDGQGDHHTLSLMLAKPFVSIWSGIFAHGFARAWCDDCGHDYFVAFSCKGRGVCPSCNTRRMVERRRTSRPRLSSPAGAPVGAVGSEAATLLYAARRASAQHGAAHLPARYCAKPICQAPVQRT